MENGVDAATAARHDADGAAGRQKIREILAAGLAKQPLLAFFAIALLIGEAILLTALVARDRAGCEEQLAIPGLICMLLLDVGGVVYLARAGKLEDSEHAQPLEEVSGDGQAAAGEIASTEAVIEVKGEVDTGSLSEPRVSALSSKGKMFFGYQVDVPSERLIGRESRALMEELKRYVDPPTSFWQDLGKDQKRVYERFMAGRPAYARVPVRFNEEHPHFKNRTFLPLIVERREETTAGRKYDITRVLYLDMTAIPLHVFREEAWRFLSRDSDLQRLAEELAIIKRSWTSASDANQRRHEIESLSQAETQLRAGGGAEVIGLCSEAGWFSLWDVARALNLEVTKEFVEKVLGRLD